MPQKSIRLLISDPTPMGCQLLALGLQKIDDGLEIVAACTKLRELAEKVAETQPDIAIVSARLAEGALAGLKGLREVHAAHPRTRCLVLLDTPQKDLIVDAFYHGVRGVCFRSDSLEALPKAIHSVHAGQIWANSAHLQYVLEALAASAPVRVLNRKGEELLTRRQLQIGALVAQGLTNREIAERLFLSEHTVKNYLFRIFDKLGISSRGELILYVLQQQAAEPTLSGADKSAA